MIDDALGGSISAVVDCILSNLHRYYVLPEAVPRIEDTIRQRRANGEYDHIRSGPEFAGILTAHLREASQDKHFFVRYIIEPQPLVDVAEPTPEMREEFRQRAAQHNCGFYKIERLPGNIGYLDLRTVSDLAGETAVAAMQVLAHTHALIIDLRKNHGGQPAMVALLCSYLLDAEPVRLNDFYWRAGDRIEQSWTLRYVPGRRYGNKPVYVLTSHETVSGGEELAYCLQALKRATLIGETTAGAAHLVMLSRVTAHIVLSLPTGRPINPLTGTNWEGTGVVPRRRDGHTFWLTPQTRTRARSTSRSSRTFGMIMTDVPPLTVAAVRPCGPAQRAGLHRGCKVLTINGQPAAHLRRFAAQALLDDSDEATNTLDVQASGGKAVAVDLRAEPVPTLISEILPGPFGMLRWDSFGRPDVVEQVRAALTSFERASVRGWIIDMRWNTGGVSSEVSRLLLDRGRIFSRLRHNEVRLPDGALIAMREDIDANGTALPFQRPLIILIGPGSMSGAESFAGPLQARGRATLVGERTAGLCGGAHHVVLAPGWEVWITAWETVFEAAEQRVNRIGVTPDVIVTPTLEDEAAGRDPQLDAALEILRRQTATH